MIKSPSFTVLSLHCNIHKCFLFYLLLPPCINTRYRNARESWSWVIALLPGKQGSGKFFSPFRVGLCYGEYSGCIPNSCFFSIPAWKTRGFFLTLECENLVGFLDIIEGTPLKLETLEVFHSQVSTYPASSNSSKLPFKSSFHLISPSLYSISALHVFACNINCKTYFNLLLMICDEI